MTNHYYRPARVAKTYGNTAPCCTRPESEHPAFPAAGTVVRIALTRPLRSLKNNILPKGTILAAECDPFETYYEESPGRWGTNILGQFAEIEKPVWTKVICPGYTVMVDGYRTGIPVNWGKEF